MMIDERSEWSTVALGCGQEVKIKDEPNRLNFMKQYIYFSVSVLVLFNYSCTNETYRSNRIGCRPYTNSVWLGPAPPHQVFL